MDMKYIGIYEVNYFRNGMMRIPKQWFEADKKQLYCALCEDLDLNTIFLRFYYEKELLMQYRKDVRENEQINVLQYCRVKQIPVWKGIILPKRFYEIGVRNKKKKLSCVGIGDGFEVWYSEDFEKMEEGFEDILEVCDI